MYRLLKKQGNARRGEFQTVHGTVQTPAFMNVATAAAIKGGLSALDLKENHCQVMLCNTYHLHHDHPYITCSAEENGFCSAFSCSCTSFASWCIMAST